MLTREDLEEDAADILNTTMQLRVFADYYGLDYDEISTYETSSQFTVETE